MREPDERGTESTRRRALFARLGGEAGVQSAVVDFYARVMCDPRLEPFFADIDMSAQIQKQIAFMTMAFDGPHKYTGRALAEAHAPLVARGLTDEHFDQVVAHLADTLRELGVDETAAREALAIVESTRAAVFDRP